jgi:hypothetical protein
MDELDKIMKEAGITEEEVLELSMMLDEAMQDLPASMGFPDWTYKDLPRMTRPLLDEFIQLVGEENIKWITFADYDNGSVRGQVILSPTAMAAIEKTATQPSLN